MGVARQRAAKGFTLLEAVIVVSLLGIVGLSFAYLYSTSQRFMIQSMNATSTQGNASFALEHVKRYLMLATRITTPAAGASGSTLEFTWQKIVNGAVTDKTSRYELNGTDLRFIDDTSNAGAFEVISQGIQSITFDRASAGTVAVDVVAQKTSAGDTRKMHLQIDVNPRGI